MTSSLALLVLAAVLVAVGVYLMLERSLSRIVLGLGAMTNGVNILFLIAGGRSGQPPIVGSHEPETMADPLVQAMMLTAIVIGLGTTAFLLSMGYRSWQLNGNDEVQDDLEDKRIARRKQAAKDEMAARSENDATLEDVDAVDIKKPEDAPELEPEVELEAAAEPEAASDTEPNNAPDPAPEGGRS